MLRKYVAIIIAGIVFTQLIHAGEKSPGLIENSTTSDMENSKTNDKSNKQKASQMQQQMASKNGYNRRSITAVIQGEKGPTIQLDYGTSNSENAIDDFMYFIPLISPVPVLSETNSGNKQTARVTSLTIQYRKNHFNAVCEFEIKGTGYFINKYDPESIIAKYSKNKRAKNLKHVIDYIKVQGTGKGSIEVLGKIVDGKKIVDEVKISFNKSSKDLLSIGLYDVNLVGNRYDYSSRFNQIVVRVNTLSFKRTSDVAKMEMGVSSVEKAENSGGFLSSFKGILADLVMEAPEIEKKGNQAMLDFGQALLEKQQSFTFTRANNLMND
jgi:hypothetical protein